MKAERFFDGHPVASPLPPAQENSRQVRTVEVLVHGRSRVADGWCQGHYNGPNGEVCSVQAIKRDPAAHAFLEKALPSRYFSVPELNDDPETRLAQVLALFDRAIALAKDAVRMPV